MRLSRACVEYDNATRPRTNRPMDSSATRRRHDPTRGGLRGCRAAPDAEWAGSAGSSRMTRSGRELPTGSERCPVGRDRVWPRRQPPRCRAAPVSSSLGLPDPPLGAASSPAVPSALLGRAFPFPDGVPHPRRRARIRRIQRTSSDSLVTMTVTRVDVVRTRLAEARGRGGCASRRIERDHHPVERHAAGTAVVKPGNGHPGLPRRAGRHHGLTNSTETVKRTALRPARPLSRRRPGPSQPGSAHSSECPRDSPARCPHPGSTTSRARACRRRYGPRHFVSVSRRARGPRNPPAR